MSKEPLITETELEAMGVEAVRQKLLNKHLNLEISYIAVPWLARKDQESRIADEASKSAQMRIARRANAIAIAALVIAMIAAVAAIVSAIFGYMAVAPQ